MKCKQCNEEHPSILSLFIILWLIIALVISIAIVLVIKNKNDLQKLENRNNPIEEHNNETNYS